MGDISEMILDGDLCESCGVYLGGGEGFPRKCRGCKAEERYDSHQEVLKRHKDIKKVKCPTCGKKVKSVGLADHMRDAHQVKEK